MFNSFLKLFAVGAVVVVVCCASVRRADAAVFRDRAAFNAAAQNLHVIDFESLTKIEGDFNVDGVLFTSPLGMGLGTQQGSKVLFGFSVGEFTQVDIFLPPG